MGVSSVEGFCGFLLVCNFTKNRRSAFSFPCLPELLFPILFKGSEPAAKGRNLLIGGGHNYLNTLNSHDVL